MICITLTDETAGEEECLTLSLFLCEDGSSAMLHVRYKGVILPHLAHDLVTVIPEVGQGGMDGPHAQLREVADDLVCALSLRLVPDIDVLDANASACDAGLAAAHTGGHLDVVCRHRRGGRGVRGKMRFHFAIIARNVA